MIPPFDNHGLLPTGIHEATWSEVVSRFGGSDRRLALLAGLNRALTVLRSAGCKRVYIDGSFVTAKVEPEDFDACWDPDGVDYRRIDPVLYDFEAGRRAQKRKYLGELFPTPFQAGPKGLTILEFFQLDAISSRSKGIVVISLEDL